MTTKHTHEIKVSGLHVEVVRKDIKNLHLAVYPPGGRVRVAVPLRVDDEAVRVAVVARLGWIRKKQANFELQERQSKREMVTGESHYVEGRRHRLAVIEADGPQGVRRRGKAVLELLVRPGSDAAKREAVLNGWYRDSLRKAAQELIQRWSNNLGVEVAELGIKRMKTRWGSCSRDARRIWLNLELAKRPSQCTEFVLVHEMLHLIERRHNDNFRRLMDQHLPQWRILRDELNRGPLAHQDWTY